MKKGLHLFAAVFFSLILCTGCIPEGRTNINISPDFSRPETIEFDFVELHNDTLDGFGDVLSSPYVFISDVDIDGDNNAHRITADATAIEGASEEDAEHFAAALLRHLDDAAYNQYPTEFELSDEESFGTLFDSYDVIITILGADGEEFYVLDIPAGGEIPLDPDIESYEEEWADYMRLYLQGQEDELAMDDEDEAEAE